MLKACCDCVFMAGGRDGIGMQRRKRTTKLRRRRGGQHGSQVVSQGYRRSITDSRMNKHVSCPCLESMHQDCTARIRFMVGSIQDSDIRRADEHDGSLNEQGKVNKLSHRQSECFYVLRARRLVGIAALAWRYDKWSTSRLTRVGMTNAATAL